MLKSYKALNVTEKGDGSFHREITELLIDHLPDNDTLIKVEFSSLNYKDALSATGHKGITKNYPFTPGVDAAGEVVECSTGKYLPGDQVIVTGYDLGMNTMGGFAEYIRVPSEWVVPLPDGLSLLESMIYGTAGFTAALALTLMERNGQTPEHGPIVITGSTGGVGSLAVAIFSKAGYEVVATTGKKDAHDFLKMLGANKIEGRDFANRETEKLLLRNEWAGAFDTVGGNTLHTLLKACKPYGNVAACGLVESPMLNLSVYPFIINGVNLLGVATAENPIEEKIKIWTKLAGVWKIAQLEKIVTEIPLDDINSSIDKILAGKMKGKGLVIV